MDRPTITCEQCGATRDCTLHMRAEHPPAAAKAWLRKRCTEPLVHDNRVCAGGCNGHLIKPCEFTYRAGVIAPRALRPQERRDG